RLFAGKKSAQIREILISESAWEEMTCLFAPSLSNCLSTIYKNNLASLCRVYIDISLLFSDFCSSLKAD
ncbi:MAG: hypothetical protein E6Y55_25160, partial [Klebsiella michiganensis]|nr:hypothetical protein [Klebsiella michiganensis]MDU6355816.1 hypothetical protein [Klebsiella grimontii]MDU6528971.1 hypothetical protein [Klebsiella grimontii]MDU7680305.1 hypothetical protein [Klebsiella grimontii]